MQGVLDALVRRVLLCAHPVGCVYMSLEATSPAVLFGGTWTQIKGRFLLATGAAEANTDVFFGQISGGWNAVAGSTGGQDYHTLTQDEMPSHTHESQYVGSASGQNYGGMYGSTTSNWWSTDYIRSAGGNNPHNNMPPYLAVYMWRRTA